MSSSPPEPQDLSLNGEVLCIGGILATVGFFLPWWVLKVDGVTHWYGPLSAYGSIRTTHDMGQVFLLTALLLSEILMCVTGAVIWRARRVSDLAMVGVMLSALVGMLGALGACGVGFLGSVGGELSYPYKAPAPFLGVAFSILGLALASLSAFLLLLRGAG